MVVMMKYMKDIIRKENHRQYKPEFLNRSCEHEKTRKRICKELVALGMPLTNLEEVKTIHTC